MFDLKISDKSLKKKLHKSIDKVFNHGQFFLGPEVEEFEKVRGIGYGVEEYEKKKKEIGKVQIKSKGNIGKHGPGEKEYFDLPYGWTKEVVYLRNQPNMKGKTRQDIYLISPGSNGKKIKSDIKLQKFLEENPNIKCDLAVTSTKKTVHTEFLMNRTFG